MQSQNDFLWGISSSSYHYEGNNYNTDWAAFEQRVFKATPDQICGQAVDHWNRWKEDYEYLSNLGINAYRYGIEWSRLEPEPGRFNAEAFAEYKEMFKYLKSKGITIVLTLFHFVSPQWFADLGGFEKKENLIYFKNFATKALSELHEYIDILTPINEINVYFSAGYLTKEWPQQKINPFLMIKVARNLARAHFIAAEILEYEQYQIKLSTAEHCRKFICTNKSKLLKSIGKYLSKVFTIKITESILENKFQFPFGFKGRVTKSKAKELDYIGFQFYGKIRFKFSLKKNEPFVDYVTSSATKTDYPVGELSPQDFMNFLRVYSSYGKDLLVTEIGISTTDDEFRERFLKEHIDIVLQAKKENIPVKGFFLFTLFDCFEWNYGYTQHFGLVGIDRKNNLKRCKKNSFEFYKELIQKNRSI